MTLAFRIKAELRKNGCKVNAEGHRKYGELETVDLYSAVISSFLEKTSTWKQFSNTTYAWKQFSTKFYGWNYFIFPLYFPFLTFLI
jgi:hypothetical protein